MNLWELLDIIDKDLFTLIHSDGAVPALDGFFKLLRDAFTWIPLYAFMLFWVIRYSRSYAWQFVLLTIVTFGVADYTSSSLLKPLFARDRPCYDSDLQEVVRGIIGCGGRNSFPSSHAANHFALAAFWFRAIFLMREKKWYWLWAWALAIGYAQVYVGKHYPFDIVAGAALGYCIGLLTALLFERWLFSQRMVYRHQQRPLPGFH